MRPRNRLQRHFARLLICATALLFGLGAQAATQSLDPRQEVAEIYELSGLDPVVADFGETVVQSLTQGGQELPQSVRRQLSQAARQNFAHGKLREKVVDQMQAQYDSRLASRAKSWLQSPLGQRITRIEVESGTAEGLEKINRTRLEFARKAPSSKRVQLVRDLMKAIGIDEFSAKLLTGTSLAVASAANAYNPSPLGFDEMRAQVERDVGPLAAQIAKENFNASLAAYNGLSDDELFAYVAFVRSAPGVWYTDSIKEALGTALVNASFEFGADIGAGFPTEDRGRSL